MSALKEFANFITLNVANLAATYERLLIENDESYQTLPADNRTAFARKLIKTAAEACELETSAPLRRLFEERITQNPPVPKNGKPPQRLLEVECLGQTLTPVVTNLEAGKFLWQTLFEARATILRVTNSAVAHSSESSQAEGGRAFNKAITEQIAERQQVGETLPKESNLLRTLIDHLPDYIFVKDTESRFIIGNTAIAKGIGVATPDDLIGKTDLDLFPPEIGGRFYADEQAVIRSGLPLIDQEELNINQAGVRKWFLTTKVPLRDNQGQVIGLVGLARDITERKLAEEMLHKAHEELERRVQERTAELARANNILQEQIMERRQADETLAKERNVLRTLIDALPDPIYAKDTQSRLIMGNIAVARLMGADTPEQLIGKTDFDFYPQEFAAQYYADERNLIETGQPILSQEEPSIDTEGNRRWVLTTKVPLRDNLGQIIGFVGVGRDITQRKQAEEALAKEHNLLRTLIDNLPDYIYVKDTESRFVLANNMTARNLGLATSEDLIGKTDFDFFPVEMAAQYHADEQAVIRSGQPIFNREESTVYENDKIGWASTTTVPLRDSQGQIIGVIGISRDITERKQAEEALRLSEERYRKAIIAAGAVPYYRDYSSNTYTFMGEGILQMTGYTVEEMTPQLWDTLEETFHTPSLMEKRRSVRAGKVTDWKSDITIRTRSGELRWINDSSIQVLNEQGTPSGSIGILQDITERKRAEEALQRSEERFRATFEHAAVGIAHVGLDSRWLWVNQKLCDIVGYTQEELLQKTLDDITYSEDFNLDPEYTRQLLAGEIHTYTRNERYVRKDNALVWVNRTVSLVREASGEPQYFIVVIEDISQRKQLEAQLEGLLTHRAQQVKTSTEVAQQISVVAALDDLFRQVVNLVQAQFGYYHVQIYTLTEDDLVLQEGTGEAGQRMKEAGHKISLEAEKSLVVRALWEGEPVLVPNVSIEPTWLPNPLLPETKAELAVPITLGAEVVGVLDVQSDTVAGLNEEDQLLLVGLCGQIAVAIDNRKIEAERQRTEEKLVEERNLLRALIDNLPDYIYIKDTESRFLLANEPMRQHLGAATLDEMIGKTDFDFSPRELAEQYYATEQAFLQAGQPMIGHEEPMYDHATDSRKWVSSTKVPFRDSQGRIAGLVGLNRDITPLKQAEEKLAEERNLLRTLIDNLPDLIYVKDAECRFVLVNRASLQVGQKTMGEIIGKTDFEVNPPELAAQYHADDQNVIRSGQAIIEREELNIDPTGQARWVSTTKIPLRDNRGQIIGLVGSSRDITERKRSEETLAEERRILRTLIDNIPDEIFIKDAQSRFLNANITVARTMGVSSPDELIGKTDLDLWPYENAIKDYQAEQALIQSGQVMINHESFSADSKRWRLETKVPVRDSQGQVVGLVGFNRFITELKEAEAERERSLAEAEARLKEIQALQQISQDLARTLQVNEILDILFQACTQVAGFEYVQVSLVDKEQHRIKGVAGIGVTESNLKKADRSLDEPDLLADIIRSGQTEILTGWDERLDRTIFESEGHGNWVRVFTPIKLREEVIGVVESGFNKNTRAAIEDFQLRLLQVFVDQTALALDNAQRFEASQEAAQRERTIREITDALRAAPNLKHLAEVAAKELGQRLSATHAKLELGIEAGAASVAQNSYIEQVWDKSKLTQKGAEYLYARPDAPPLFETISAQAKVQALVQKGPAIVSTDNNEASSKVLVAPVTLSGETIGALQLHKLNADDSDQVWQEQDLALVMAVLDQIAQTAENLRLFEETRERAAREQAVREITDKLRAAPNLDLLLETAARELGQHLGVRHTVLELGIKAERNGRLK